MSIFEVCYLLSSLSKLPTGTSEVGASFLSSSALPVAPTAHEGWGVFESAPHSAVQLGWAYAEVMIGEGTTNTCNLGGSKAVVFFSVPRLDGEPESKIWLLH